MGIVCCLSNTSVTSSGNLNLSCITVYDVNAAWNADGWFSKAENATYSFNCPSAPETNITDANFEQALIDLGIDTEGTLNGLVLTSDVASVLTIDLEGRNISDLTGIESFTNLVYLESRYNRLTNINLTQNIELKFLKLYHSSVCIQGCGNPLFAGWLASNISNLAF